MTDSPQPGTSTGAPSEDRDRDQEEPRGPIIRDKRRIDPETGAVRDLGSSLQPTGDVPSGQPAPVPDAGGAPAPEQQLLELELAERTSDLQRLQAEYANYRRRVERDREVQREQAVAAVLTNFLPILDDIGRAREHAELEGGFRSVGEALEQTVEKLGLTRFGEPGDAFDPTLHEALTHGHSTEVTQPTCVQIFSPGYRIGDRVVRPARVGVVEPE